MGPNRREAPHDILVTECPRQRMEQMAKAANEGIKAIGYFNETADLLRFICAPAGSGFLCAADRDGRRYTKALEVAQVTSELLASTFFELSKMVDAKVVDGDELQAHLAVIATDIAAGKRRSVALTGAACAMWLEDGAVVMEATAADGLRLGFRTERAPIADTLMSLLAQANKLLALRETRSTAELVQTLANRGASFTHRRKGGIVSRQGKQPHPE